MGRFVFGVVVLCCTAAFAEEPQVAAEVKRVHGHVGVVTPLVTAHASGVTSIASGPVIGVTSGLGLGIAGPLAFDFELVMLIDPLHRVVNIVAHPGALLALGKGFTAGLRGAWETQGAWGFTPLVNKGFDLGGAAFYVEAAFPMRWAMVPGSSIAATVALHLGVGF